MIRFPVLQGRPPFAPQERVCLLCEGPIKDQLIYLSGGAHEGEFKAEKMSRLRGFLSVGIHTHDERARHVDVVVDSYGGQFDLSFCSHECLADFLASIAKQLAEPPSRSPGASQPDDH